jgi:LysM repeat protein
MRSNLVKYLLSGLSLLIVSACGGGEEPVLVPATMVPTTTLMELSTTIPITTTTYVAPIAITPVVVETTTTTTVVEPEETEPESVTVTAGDSLSEIAKANGTTAEKLARINGICNANSIYVGQVILLSSPEIEVEINVVEESLRTVVVEAGDSLSKIAKRESVTVDEIMSMNNITDPNLLFVGQELTISGQVSPEPQEDPVC